jgi:signal transduction histidine kinase
MKRWLASLSRLSRARMRVLTFTLAVVIGALDFATGYDLRLAAFYLVPICLGSWAVGRGTGLLLAVVCSLCFEGARLLADDAYLHPMLLVWNGLMMLAWFLIMGYWPAELKAEVIERERAEKAKRQAERQLERQEKLAVLGTLTSGIAHEIRNPLTSLKARLYTLEKHIADLPAARRDAEIIGSEISRLERVVNDALSFARPREPRIETIAANTLLREIHGLMAGNLENRGVQLDVAGDPGLLIQGDSGHLKQVLVNLVQNAGEAITGAGKIVLNARPRRAVLAGRETDAVALEVTDTGNGIPPEVERRLFDPFFSTKETGTGLGLSIALRMVEKQGGRMEYETRPGQGTTFSVVLPRRIPETTAHANQPAAAEPAGDMARR